MKAGAPRLAASEGVNGRGLIATNCACVAFSPSSTPTFLLLPSHANASQTFSGFEMEPIFGTVAISRG